MFVLVLLSGCMEFEHPNLVVGDTIIIEYYTGFSAPKRVESISADNKIIKLSDGRYYRIDNLPSYYIVERNN